jgi:hypothetical protein
MQLDGLKVDDAFEDAKAAYAEVAGKVSEAPATDAGQSAEAPTGQSADADSGADKRNVRVPPKDERGRFAKKADKPAEAVKAETGTDDAEAEEEASQAQEKPAKAASPAGGPPPSWSVKSKSAWEQLPEAVRADIAKRETEVSQGLAALRDYKDLKPYAELAQKHNTTISAALKHYTGIEAMLRKDIGQGLAQIVQNYGLDQAKAAQLFANLAQRYGGQAAPAGTPHGANGQPQTGDPLYAMLKPFIDPLQNEVAQLRTKLSSREVADRNASEQSLAKSIQSFSGRPENRYFADLEETITRLFETGMVPLTGNHEGDLRTAYDTAAQMHPEVREALIDQRLQAQKDAARQLEQEAADKAKKASRSLTGSRIPGTVVQQPSASNGHDDIEADVRAAYRLHAQH